MQDQGVADFSDHSLTKAPVVSLEMALLQSCAYKLPHDKARELLGYQPLYSFSEGMQRSIGWLSFVGYPVS